MHPVAHEDTSACFIPFAGNGGAGAFQAFLSFHVQDPALLGPDDFSGFEHCRSVHEVFGVHKPLPGFCTDCPQLIQFLQQVLIHELLGDLLADRFRISGLSEVTYQRLFADHMFPRPHSLDNLFLVHIRRSADIDNVNFRIIEQVVIVRGTLLKSVEFDGFVDLLLASSHYGLQPAGDVGPFISEGMEFQCAACADNADGYSVCHGWLVSLLFILY